MEALEFEAITNEERHRDVKTFPRPTYPDDNKGPAILVECQTHRC